MLLLCACQFDLHFSSALLLGVLLALCTHDMARSQSLPFTSWKYRRCAQSHIVIRKVRRTVTSGFGVP
eukprot:6180494-Amphidinium_carterae.1